MCDVLNEGSGRLRRGIEIVLWTDEDAASNALVAKGVPLLSSDHDFLNGKLRSAWIADPDGNPIPGSTEALKRRWVRAGVTGRPAFYSREIDEMRGVKMKIKSMSLALIFFVSSQKAAQRSGLLEPQSACSDLR